MQSLVEVGDIAWEEFEKVSLQHFTNLQEKKKKKGMEMDVAYITRFSTIQWTRGCKVLNVRQSMCEFTQNIHTLMAEAAIQGAAYLNHTAVFSDNIP